MFKKKIVFSQKSLWLYFIIGGTDASQDDDDEEEFDWSIEQIPCEELSSLNILGKQCGFGNSYSYAVFKMKVIIFFLSWRFFKKLLVLVVLN